MTFLELKQAVYADTGFISAPPTEVITRVGRWINEAHKRVLRDPAMSNLRQGTFSFASVASQTTYALPEVFENIDGIVQESNNVTLRLMTPASYRLIDPGETAIGNPYYYVPLGWESIYVKPDQSTGTGIWAESTSAADTTQTVTIQGVRLNGDLQGEISATLTGTSRVALGTITDYIDVRTWNISAVAVGTIRLINTLVAGTELARIRPGAKSVQYNMIRLWPTPSAVLSYRVDGQLKVGDMIADTDIPLFPPTYHDVLADYGRMREYERTGDSRYGTAKVAYEDGSVKLREYVQFPPDYRPIAGRLSQGGVGWTNLPGGFFPTDRGWP